MALSLIPTSPIHGMVNTPGDATHPPFIQLLNGVSSGVNLVIYEIRIAGEGFTNRFKARRTASPLTGAGTSVVGLLERRDQRDVTAIQATLTGYNGTTLTAFTEALSAWLDKPAPSGSAGSVPQTILWPGSYPWLVKPGSALEVGGSDNGTGVLARAYFVFDELAV